MQHHTRSSEPHADRAADRNRQPVKNAPDRTQEGFTLIELIIGVAVMVEVMIVGYLLFDVSTKTARVQTDVADMQQSQRVANYDIMRNARMAGRGGVPGPVAVNVNDNVDGDTFTIAGNPVVDGSDVLTIRGVLSNPIWLMAKNAFSFDAATSVGTLTLRSRNNQGIAQDFSLLEEVLDDGLPVPIVIVSIVDPSVYGVAVLSGGNVSSPDADGIQTATVTFDASNGGTHNDKYLPLSAGGVFPNLLISGAAPAWIGILEEYRYYVRDDQDSVTGASPKLSRAQFYPNTNTLYRGNAANGRVDIADNVIDLQVALALDLNGDGTIAEDASSPDSDEWLFNDSGDAETDQYWGLGDADGAWGGARLFQLRLSTMVRSERRDNTYFSEFTPTIENHTIDDQPIPTSDEDIAERRFRRRVMRSVVDLRNVS